MRQLRHIGLFEGIGGFSIAGHWAGWETIAWCEYASFPQKVLRHHFPTADELHDVTTADFTIYRGRVDVLTGGFPCQPFSHAGQRRGTEDDRYLWPHMLRAINECRPTWVVGENVAGLASMAFPARSLGVDLQATVTGQEAHRDMEAEGVLDSICRDLERAGYDVQPLLIPACATNAPHRRDRIWIIGYNAANAQSGRAGGLRDPQGEAGPREGSELLGGGRGMAHEHGNAADTDQIRFCGQKQIGQLERFGFGFNSKRKDANNWQDFPTQPPVCGGNDGLSELLDADALFEGKKGGKRTAQAAYNLWRNETIKAYGNAIVPQVFYEIAKAINAVSSEPNE